MKPNLKNRNSIPWQIISLLLSTFLITNTIIMLIALGEQYLINDAAVYGRVISINEMNAYIQLYHKDVFRIVTFPAGLWVFFLEIFIWMCLPAGYDARKVAEAIKNANILYKIWHNVALILAFLLVSGVIANTLIVLTELTELNLSNNLVGNIVPISEMLVFFQQDSRTIIRLFVAPAGIMMLIIQLLIKILFIPCPHKLPE